MEHKKIICYHHTDMDGIASAAIVKQIYPKAKFVKVDYDDDDWDVNDVIDSLCIVVDFSFPNMDELKQYPDMLCWIDHHESAKKRNPELWNSKDIDGLRGLGASGCELTWVHFHGDKKMPEAIKLIGDMDLWKFYYGHRTKQFMEAINLYINSPTDARWEFLLTNDKDALIDINNWCRDGETLLLAKRRRVELTFEAGTDGVIDGHKCRIVNTNHDISAAGEFIYEKKKYPVAVIFFVKQDKIIVNLRSNTVDVGKIAMKRGGGGHKFASGYTIKDTDFKIEVEQVK